MFKYIKGWFLKTVCVALTFITVVAFCFPLMSYAAAGDYDYSGNIETANETLDSVDLLELYLGEQLIKAEYDYLKKYGTMSMTYENGLSATKQISVDYSFVDQHLTVIAKEYQYIAKNGKEIRWIPKTVTLGDDSRTFNSNGLFYTADFEGVEKDDNLVAKVDYALDIVVKKDDINALINCVYNDFDDIKAEIAEGEQEYSDALAQHQLMQENYAAFLEYEAAMKKYNTYLSEKKAYDKALEKYNKYLTELEAYNKALEEYKAYEVALGKYNTDLALYQKYLSDLRTFEENKVKYAEYLEKIAVISEQLKIIEATRQPMTDQRQIYSTIRGPLVDKVLAEEKTLIKHFKVPEKIVYMAGDATDMVRKLLNEYFALSTDREKYEYYINNFDLLKKNITDLTQSLAFLYRNNKVNAALKDQMDEGDDRKYRILVGQLAMVAGCLNGKPINTYFPEDNELFDKNYVFEVDGTGDSIGSLLKEEQNVFVISNPIALQGGYPKQMEEPVAPNVVAMPSMPKEPAKPIEPTKVDNPGSPPAVVTEPEYVEKVDKPGDPPSPYVPDPDKLAVVEACESLELKKRTELSEDYVYTFTDTLTKKVFNNKTVDVLFYVGDKEILCTIDKGDRVIYPGSKPTKVQDEKFTYEFDGWVDADGNAVDLARIEKDICLYPNFKAIDRYYTVTFVVDGAEYSQSLKYGAMPEFDETSIIKPDDNMYHYTFSGWDKPVSSVKSDVTYIAQFDKKFIFSAGGVGVEIVETDDYFEAELDIFETVDITPMLLKAIATEENTGLVKHIKLNSKNGAIDIDFALIKEMYTNGYTFVECAVQTVNDYKLMLNIAITNGEGVKLNSDVGVDVSLFCNMKNIEKAVLYYYEQDSDNASASTVGTKKYVGFEYDDGCLISTLNTACVYYLSVENTVSVISTDYLVTVSTSVAHPGEWISVVCEEAPLGMKLNRVYVIYPGGREEVIEEGFYMPESSVSVGAEYIYLEYKIVFMVGETVLSEKMYKYGEEVEVPMPPEAVVKDGYTYAFEGWNSDVVTVTEDKIYEAVISKTPISNSDILDQPELPEKSDDDGYTLIYKLITAAKVCLYMLAFVVIPSLVILCSYNIIGRTNRKKKNK